MGKKFIVFSLIIILISSVLSVSVFAADGDDDHKFTLIMNARSSKVVPGGEVLITVKISNLNVGNDGVSQFRSYLDYDTDVFEQITESSIDGIDGWKPSVSVGTGKIQIYRDKPLKTDGEIMQISLKVKAGVAEGTQTDVGINQIALSDSVNEYSTQPVSTSITVTNDTGGIGAETPSTPVSNQQPIPINISTPTPTQNNTVAPVNNQVNNVVNNTVNNTSNGIQVVNEVDSDMPYTGSDSGALARIIIGVIFIALVMYIKIERMNKEIK